MAIAFVAQAGVADEDIASITKAITTSANSTLVAIVGANAYGASAENDCKISSVIDDAHNIWVEAVTECGTSAGDLYAATRISIWVCIGARAVTTVTATGTQNTDAMSINVVEATGIGPTSTALEVVASGDYDGAGPVPAHRALPVERRDVRLEGLAFPRRGAARCAEAAPRYRALPGR